MIDEARLTSLLTHPALAGAARAGDHHAVMRAEVLAGSLIQLGFDPLDAWERALDSLQAHGRFSAAVLALMPKRDDAR